jgi:uncharacterized protein GlcG (DUF336 family)
MNIPYPVARCLGLVAETAAADLGVAMAIALVDAEGSLQYFLRMEGALPASTEIARSKAYTAAALRMSTEELGRLALPGGPLYGIQHTHDGKIILFGGGVPLGMQDRVAGAIGISGGTVAEDLRVAEAAVAAWKEMGEWAARMRPLLAAQQADNRSLTRVATQLRDALQKDAGTLSGEFLSLLIGALILAFREP